MTTVNDILKQRSQNSLYSVSPDTSVYDALKMMGEKNAGSVLVLDSSGNMLGIFTERDYARKIVLLGKKSRETMVKDIMTPAEKIVSVTTGSSLDDCMQKMTGNKIRHLPVLENGKPVTVISIGDVVFAVIQQQKETISHLSSYIQG